MPAFAAKRSPPRLRSRRLSHLVALNEGHGEVNCHRSQRRGGHPTPLPLPTLPQQPLRLPRQIRRDPQHVIPVFLSGFLEPPIAVAVAAPQQGVQLGQFDFEEVSGVFACGGGRRGRAACAAGRLGRGTPGHNSISHLVCSLSKVMHVMWSDGQGVHAPWPSPFVPHIRVAASQRGSDTRREARRFIRSSIDQWMHGEKAFLSRGSSAATAGRLVAGAFTVEKRSCAREKNSSTISRIDEISEVPRFFCFTGGGAKQDSVRGRPPASARAWRARLRCRGGPG